MWSSSSTTRNKQGRSKIFERQWGKTTEELFASLLLILLIIYI